MTKSVECSRLASLRVQRKNFGQCLEHGVLQLQIFAASLSLLVFGVPVIAKRVPPHVDRSIEGFSREKTFEQIEHASNTRHLFVERQIAIQNDFVDAAVEVGAKNYPEALLKLSRGKLIEEELRACE